MLSKIHQTKKDKYGMVSLILRMLKKKKKGKLNFTETVEKWLPGDEGLREIGRGW